MTTVTVRPGDSLWAIAEKNQTSVEAIQAANPQLRDPNLLKVGQELKLPQDSFERQPRRDFELTQREFLQTFQGQSLSLDALTRDDRVSARVSGALSRADKNADGQLRGESELRTAFGVLDSFDRNGRRHSIDLIRGGRTLALGGVVNALSQSRSVSEPVAPTSRETPSLDAVSRGAVLEFGDSGRTVKALQSRLMQLGYDAPRTERYDQTTQENVLRFQRDFGVETTGQFGPTTLSALTMAELQTREAFDALERFVLVGGELGLGEVGAAVVDLQRLLNRRGASVEVDGIFGPGTRRALSQFQERQSLAVTGRVGSTTLQSLSSLPSLAGITGDQLRQITPGLSPSRADSLSGFLNLAMAEADISTPQRQAMFLAQVAHESGGFRYNEEIASGVAYEWRRDLGNIYAGDGRRYKGRGFIQLTGRANYRDAGRALGLDLESNPMLASTDLHAARVAAWYWDSRKINQPADQGNFLEVTRRINGGTNGYWDRMRYYNKAQEVLV